jgi:hypothetical protein
MDYGVFAVQKSSTNSDAETALNIAAKELNIMRDSSIIVKNLCILIHNYSKMTLY